MAERALRNRKRRASKGTHIRVSDEVYAELSKTRGDRSWDTFLRWLFGLDDRLGRPQPLIEGVLEVHTGTFILKSPETPWKEAETIALRMAVIADGKRRHYASDRPVRMREVR